MNESGSLFHCACLICPLSFLHQPIFSDIVAPPPSSRLVATYVTLTNHRLRGQRLTLRRLSPPGFDVIGPVVCSNSPVPPFGVQKRAFSHCIPLSPHIQTTIFLPQLHYPPPPQTTSHLPPSFLGAEHIGVLHLSGPARVSVRARNSTD